VSIGFPIGKADIDIRAAQTIVNVRDSLQAAVNLCNLLQDTSVFANDAALTALGYTQAEVNVLRAAFTDMKALYNIAHNAGTQATPNDFFFNAKHLVGTV
jgi:hypothetical protein